MSTLYNINNFKALGGVGENFIGDIFNIAHDGTALVNGTQPGISLDSRQLTADWTINLIVKSSSLLEQVVFSIGDGAGGRYLDVTQTGGNTMTLWFDGVSTSITYTDQAVPLSQWISLNVGYDISENNLTLAVTTAGIDTTANGAGFVTVQPVATPSIPAGRRFSFFKGGHSALTYDGVLDTYRIASSYQSLTLTHASAFVFSSTSQATSWYDNGSSYFTRFTSQEEIEVEMYSKASAPVTKYHSFAPYDEDVVVAAGREWDGTVGTMYTSSTTQTNNLGLRNMMRDRQTTGLHYFPSTNLLLFIDASTYPNSNDVGKLSSYPVNGTETEYTRKSIVSDVGTYYHCRGEIHGRYLFGTKLAADGVTNQFFRTDASGLNEITVDVETLTGTNGKIESFAMNSDDDLLYFGDPSTLVLSTMDFDLTNYDGTTFGLVLNTNKDASIEYSDGWLYWGDKYPFSTADNASIWRIFVQPGAAQTMQRLNKNHDIGSFGVDQNVVFVDRAQNRMIMSGYNMQYLQFPTGQTENNFAAPGMNVGFRNATSLNLTWTAVAGATGYTLLQDGVAIETNTTSTSKHVTGLTDGTHYRFTLQYTTDGGSTFLPAYYQTLSAAPTSTDGYFPHIPELVANGNLSSMCGFVDPYNPIELMVNQGHNVYKHNLETGTTEPLGSIWTGVGGHQQRLLANGEVWHLLNNNTKIYNAGVGLINRTKIGVSTSVNVYTGDVSNLVMDHSTATGGNADLLQSFTVTLDGTTIYYTTKEEDLWKYDIATNTTAIIYAGVGTSNTRSISLDPLDQNSMIFTDNAILKHIDLTTYTVTEIKTGMSAANVQELLGGVVYGCMFYGGFYTMNVDGTNYQQLFKPGSNFNAMTLDTVNKRVIFVENKGVKVYPMPTMADLPDDPTALSVGISPISLDMDWQAIDGATSYTVTYTVGGSSTVLTPIAGTTSTIYSISGLDPETTYTVNLYYATAENPSNLFGSATKTTLADLDENYSSTSFSDGSGGFNMSNLTALVMASMGSRMNTLFTTGQKIQLNVGGSKRSTTFVRLGETAALEENGGAISIPFRGDGGAGQSASITLSDGVTTVAVAFDETTEQITVNGISYTSGDTFILDGKKVTIVDV